MSSIGHPCCTIQGSVRYLSLMKPGPVSITSLVQAKNLCSTIQASVEYLFLMRPTVVLLPRWTNNHYPMLGLDVVINLYKMAFLPAPLQTRHFSRQSVTITIGLTIGSCSDNRLSGHSGECAIGQALILSYVFSGMLY